MTDEAKPTTQAAPDEPKLTAEEWVESGRLVFGVSPHIIAGVLAVQTRKTFSKTDVERLLKKDENRATEIDPHVAEQPGAPEVKA